MLDKLTQIMRHLYPSEQKVLSQATAEQRLTELATLDSVNSQAFMRTYTQYLLPMSCSHSGVERLQALMSQPQTYSSTTLKGIANAIDAEKECLRVQQALER